MVVKLSSIEARALAIIWRWQAEKKNSPSVSELARELGRTHSGTKAILYRLEAKYYIELERSARLLIVPLVKE